MASTGVAVTAAVRGGRHSWHDGHDTDALYGAVVEARERTEARTRKLLATQQRVTPAVSSTARVVSSAPQAAAARSHGGQPPRSVPGPSLHHQLYARARERQAPAAHVGQERWASGHATAGSTAAMLSHSSSAPSVGMHARREDPGRAASTFSDSLGLPFRVDPDDPRSAREGLVALAQALRASQRHVLDTEALLAGEREARLAEVGKVHEPLSELRRKYHELRSAYSELAEVNARLQKRAARFDEARSLADSLGKEVKSLRKQLSAARAAVAEASQALGDERRKKTLASMLPRLPQTTVTSVDTDGAGERNVDGVIADGRAWVRMPREKWETTAQMLQATQVRCRVLEEQVIAQAKALGQYQAEDRAMATGATRSTRNLSRVPSDFWL